MRYLFFITILSSALISHAQLLDPKSEWFENHDFFNESTIEENSIQSILIHVEDKKDGEIIKSHGDFYHYDFDQLGRLVLAMKSIPLAKRIDTSSAEYVYKNGKLERLIEKYGPFHFQYHYYYKNKVVNQEFKLDYSKKVADTLYKRSFTHQSSDFEELTFTLNEKGKAFQKESRRYTEKGMLALKKLSYLNGRTYQSSNYEYKKEQLFRIKNERFFSKKKITVLEFLYENDKLKTINYYQNGKISLKREIVYQENGLISAIVERGHNTQSIRIYNFNYRFY